MAMTIPVENNTQKIARKGQEGVRKRRGETRSKTLIAKEEVNEAMKLKEEGREREKGGGGG